MEFNAAITKMAGRKICCLLGNSGNLHRKTQLLVASIILRTNTSWQPVDTETHTGQKFDPTDKRLVRFVDRPKEVNQQWAIDLINDVPPEATESRIVSCNGGGGPLGHPKVFINLDQPGSHCCGYCGLRFYKDGHHH